VLHENNFKNLIYLINIKKLILIYDNEHRNYVYWRYGKNDFISFYNRRLIESSHLKAKIGLFFIRIPCYIGTYWLMQAITIKKHSSCGAKVITGIVHT
jgi:hypothetical protein